MPEPTMTATELAEENHVLRKRLRELDAAATALREQCNRQEHGFARRESALQGELAAALLMVERVQLLSVCRARLAQAWAQFLDAERAEHAKAKDRLFQHWLAKHTLDDVDPDIEDAADRAAGGPLLAGCRLGFRVLREAGFRLVGEADDAVLDACAAIPDITLSKWACNPGGHWEPVREALRAARAAAGFDVDAELDQYDHDTGKLLARREAEEAAAARAMVGACACGDATQHAPAPDYRTSEES